MENKKSNKIEEKKKIAGAEKEIAKDVEKIEEKVAHHKISQKEADKEISKEVAEEISKEVVKEKKSEEKKIEFKPKTEAVVNGRSIPISIKHSIAVCNFIRNKNIDYAIFELEKVEKKKIAVPMRGEIPHRRGMMSGRYPVNAVKHFIILLKSLKANALVNGMEIEKYKIACKSDVAFRPFKKAGRRAKRAHIIIKLIQMDKTQ